MKTLMESPVFVSPRVKLIDANFSPCLESVLSKQKFLSLSSTILAIPLSLTALRRTSLYPKLPDGLATAQESLWTAMQVIEKVPAINLVSDFLQDGALQVVLKYSMTV